MDYNKLLEKAKSLHDPNKMVNAASLIEELFPELKESEDEQHRKWILDYLYDGLRKSDEQFKGEFKCAIVWLEKQGKLVEEYEDKLDRMSCESFDKGYKAALEKQNEPQVRTGSEWVRTIDDACDKRYAEEYAHGEYCHEQSFKWGFQEGVDWLEKQGEQKTVSKTEPIVEGLTTEFQKQVSHLIASAMDKEHEYTKGYIEWVAQSLLGYAKNEQTPTNNVEPKFNVGDWVVWNNHINCHIDNIYQGQNTLMYTISVNGVLWSDSVKDFDAKAHLWTIQDAKDGDVLVASDGSIFIFKEIVDYGCKHYIALTKDSETINVNDNLEHFWETTRGVKPSTKEQRDLLFHKMKEAGYEWDAEKKELKKIEQKSIEEINGEDFGIDGLWHAIRILEKSLGEVDGYQSDDGILEHKAAMTAVKKLYDQKPAWSEEDEMMLQQALSTIRYALSIPIDKEDEPYFVGSSTIAWLKSLKDRIAQSYWNPTEEQLTALNNAIEWCVDTDKDKPLLISLYKALKKN